jgi:Flp pilus assembly CpaE family ATPase
MADGIVALALVGGDERLERELVALSAELDGVAVLPESAADRADALLIADGQRGAALDRARAELAARPDRRVLLVGAPGSIDAAEAMACGARALLEHPLTAERVRSALSASGCLDERPVAPAAAGARSVVLLGATGGAGTTTCAVALARSLDHAVLIDLDLACGDAAAVAGAVVESPDALLSLAYAPGIGAGELDTLLAHGPGLRVLPAPELPEQADLVDEGGVAQVLDAVRRAGRVAIVDGGTRIGVETLPALERASAIVIVSPPGANGRRGVARLSSLLLRLGLAERPVGLAASRVWPHRRGDQRELATAAGLPLWATVGEHPSVARAARAGAAPPERPFAGLVAALAERVAT